MRTSVSLGLFVVAALVAACTGAGASPSATSPAAAASSPSAMASPESAAPASTAPSGSPSGSPAAGASAAASGETVSVADSSLGKILVDGQGKTLYLFMPDASGTPTCYQACAKAWPPLLSQGGMSVGAGLDATKFSTVPRTDGGAQIRIDKWPLYHFGGDVAAGQTNGQGLLGKWYVVSPSGQAIK